VPSWTALGKIRVCLASIDWPVDLGHIQLAICRELPKKGVLHISKIRVEFLGCGRRRIELSNRRKYACYRCLDVQWQQWKDISIEESAAFPDMGETSKPPKGGHAKSVIGRMNCFHSRSPFLVQTTSLLTFICTYIASVSLKYNQQDATFSRPIYFYKLL